MASLADITHLFVSSLAQVASAAWTTLDQDTGSAHTFYQTCMSLVGVVEGNWTKAYENKFVQNNGRSELIQAKINDFYSASKSLGPDIEELCTRYDNLSPLVGGGVDDGLGQLNITRFLHEDALEGVLIPERDAFIYGVTLEAVLDQGGAAETISYLLANKQSEIINRLSSIYEQDMHANKENKAFQKDLTASHETAIEAIQALTKRLQKHLAEWAEKLYFLVRGYQKAIETASHIDKITLADIDYEIKLNPTAPVIIWQQPDGHLLIAVTGAPGNSEETVMQWIRAYLQDHGMTGKRPSVTLLGFDGGVRIAQQIIGIAYPQLNSGPFFNPFAPVGPPFANHTGDLPFTITQAFFVGQNLKLPSHGNLGKIAFQTVRTDPIGENGKGKKEPWWDLSTEEWTLMGITASLQLIPGVGEVGDSLATGEVFHAVLGLGKEKIIEYAVSVGWKIKHREGGEVDVTSAANFLAQKIESQVWVADGPISSPSGG